MEKCSMISKKTYKNQMGLSYDCLDPEMASKLLNCFYDDKLCELLCFCETDLTFNTCKMDGRYSKELVMFIEMPEYDEKDASQEEIDQQMEADRKELLAIQQRIKMLCGIE